MGKKCTNEPQELINFCLDKCTESDCDGTDGCYACQVERARLLGLPAPEKPKRGPYKTKEKPLALPEAKKPKKKSEPEKDPVIVLEEAPAIQLVSSEQHALRKINEAIVALDAALQVIPSNMWTSACIELPDQLRSIRREVYDHLVDWNAIAGGGLTPTAGGGV